MLLPSKIYVVPRHVQERLASLPYVKAENPVLFVNTFYVLSKCASSSAASERERLHCYRTLKVPVGCSFDEVRKSFIALAKKYHPDGGSPEADATKFQEVESAYRILQFKYSHEENTGKDSTTAEDSSSIQVTEFDIQHTAPQHRQYLSFDGCGIGTPSQRQKQYQKMRAVQAADNLISHRIQKINLGTDNREEALTLKDKVEARKIKTRFGMDRLVEDLIQESMAKGDFDNLPGKGKPLKDGNFNPYVDFVTHKLNEVLIENGFTPQWITLQKEIRFEREALRDSLCEKRACLGPLPLSNEEELIWQSELEKLLPVVNQINAKISKYNLLVPILHKQMLQIQLNREAKSILENGIANTKHITGSSRTALNYHSKLEDKDESFLGLLSSLFGGK